MAEYLTFNFEYQEAYTSSITFDTQINEKQKGKEQRYPKWTYPKRVFTLKFDKNFEERQELENFFIKVMQSGGKFYWVWEKDKGGNGKKYTCFFENESFKQNIKNLGYTECEVSIVCIDNSAVEAVGNFDFYHDAECEHSLEYYRVMDSVFTAANNIKVWWDSPKKSWTLEMDKDPVVRKKLDEEYALDKRLYKGGILFQVHWATLLKETKHWPKVIKSCLIVYITNLLLKICLEHILHYLSGFCKFKLSLCYNKKYEIQRKCKKFLYNCPY